MRVLRGGDDSDVFADFIRRRVGARIGAGRAPRQHHDLVAGGGERGRQVMDVPAEPADHHRWVLPRHHQDFHRGSLRASSAPNSPSARFQPSARRCATSRRPDASVAGDLAGGVRVQMRPVAGVVGGGVLAHHERPVAGHREQGLAQDLVGDVVAGDRPVQRRGLGQRLVDGGQRGVDDLGVELHQVGDFVAGPHLPVLAGTPRAGRQFDGIADEALADGVAERADAHARLRQCPQHPFQPHRTLVPPVAEQFGVEGGDDVRGPPDALGFGQQSAADHVDEIGDVRVDCAIGALGIVGRLLVRRHVAAGDAGRLQAGAVVVGVEVAVGGVAGVAGFR